MARKQKDDDRNPCIIRLALVRPIGTETAASFEALATLARDCDLLRNGMVSYWRRWREDHPDWQPDAKQGKDGQPRRKKDGTIIRCNLPAPKVDGVTFATAMYRRGRQINATVSSHVVAMLSQEMWNKLKAKAAWRVGRTAFYVWESILLYESNPPTSRTECIPIPNNSLKIGWDDCCWVDFPVRSKETQPSRLRFECKIAKLPRPLKDVLQRAIAGELKIADSRLVKKKRYWELHLNVPVRSASSDCDPRRSLLLRACGPDEDRPFSVTLPNGEELPVGAGVPLVREYERLTMRRKAIRAAGRLGAMKGGHGERRVMRAVTSESRRFGGVQAAFFRQLADIVYNIAVREKCGVVEYEEPVVKSRDKSWFAARDTPFNWDQQQTRLLGKLKRRGIVLNVTEGYLGDHDHGKEPVTVGS